MKRYSPTLVVLHWLLALFIFVALFMGQDIAALSNDLDLKVDRLVIHMIAGVIIGLGFIARIVIKWLNPNSVPQIQNDSPIQKLAKLFHNILYLLVFAVVLSGIGIAIEVDMLDIVSQGETMPSDLPSLLPRKAHGILTKLLSVAIGLHLLAALYHQWVLKDNLLSRMWFRKKHE